MIEEIRENLEQNLARVEKLVCTYESHPDAQGKGRKSAEVLDILRAAVVLLHASLEDLLRGIAHSKLPSAAPAVLNEIPLVGLGPNPRKFLLGDLAPFRGKSVDQVFVESVNAHLEHSNYNNTQEIANLLNAVGIDVAKVNSRFGDLQALMERRHQIVHRADRQPEVIGRGDHEVRAINKRTVRDWAESVRQFSTALFAAL